MAVKEGAATGILPGETDAVAVIQQGGVSQGLRKAPVDRDLPLSHGDTVFVDLPHPWLQRMAVRVADHALRQPLEAGEITIARANHRITYPTRVQLVAAMNPCRCGLAGQPGYSCRQGTNCQERYLARVSGPILDRIDIRINVPQVTAMELSHALSEEGSAEIRQRVEAARQLQHQRYRTIMQGKAITNAECPPTLLEKVAEPDAAGQKILHHAASTFGLSARGYHRTLRVARTLADLDGLAKVHKEHIAEALVLRGANGKRAITQSHEATQQTMEAAAI